MTQIDLLVFIKFRLYHVLPDPVEFTGSDVFVLSFEQTISNDQFAK